MGEDNKAMLLALEYHTSAYWVRHQDELVSFLAKHQAHTPQYDRAFARRRPPIVPMGKPTFNLQRKQKKEQGRNDYLVSVGRFDEIIGNIA